MVTIWWHTAFIFKFLTDKLQQIYCQLVLTGMSHFLSAYPICLSDCLWYINHVLNSMFFFVCFLNRLNLQIFLWEECKNLITVTKDLLYTARTLTTNWKSSMETKMSPNLNSSGLCWAQMLRSALQTNSYAIRTIHHPVIHKLINYSKCCNYMCTEVIFWWLTDQRCADLDLRPHSSCCKGHIEMQWVTSCDLCKGGLCFSIQ